MTYAAAMGSFTRTFSDSTLGCDNRGPLTSHNVHVSDVDMVALGTPREAVVTLSNIRFGTTGFNLCSPSNNAQPISGEDANGDIVVDCVPMMNPDGSVSTTVVNASADEISCGDGHGALINISCSGTGIPGSTTINAVVTISLEQNCGSHQENTSNAQTFIATNLVPGQPQIQRRPARVCDEFRVIAVRERRAVCLQARSRPT